MFREKARHEKLKSEVNWNQVCFLYFKKLCDKEMKRENRKRQPVVSYFKRQFFNREEKESTVSQENGNGLDLK